MIQAKLWDIIYMPQDGDPCNVFAVGVDMDDQTAEMLAVKDYKSSFALEGTDAELGDDFFLADLGEVYWTAVPEQVDGFDINLADLDFEAGK
jgi:hypothetical protein